MKKAGIINLISLFLIIISFLFFSFLFFSINSKEDKQDEEETTAKSEKNFNLEELKKYQESYLSQPVFKPTSSIFPNAPIPKENLNEKIYIRAYSSVAIDAETGTILYYNKGKEKRAIASLTKIMTAIVVLDKIKEPEKEIVKIDREAIYAEGTTIGCPTSTRCISNTLYLGEEVYAQNLLEAMLINSANDAAIALAKHIAGSQERFADLMNEKVRQLGLKDTNFCNPSGLDEEERLGQCYSTAYDFARITAYSLQYPRIWDILKLKEKEFYSVKGDWSHKIFNTDLLLEQMPNCLGAKTGFTYEAGKSLMAVAHHPQNYDHRVIGVLLNDEYRWEDMKKLLEWSFENYQWP